LNTSPSCPAGRPTTPTPARARILRFVEITVGFAALGTVLGIIIAALVGCTSQQVHDNTPGIVDTTKAVLNAVGLGALSPLADSVGKLVMWVAGPPAVAAAGCYHKYRGLPLVGARRRKLKEEDDQWDEVLDHAEEFAKLAPAVADVAGGSKKLNEKSAAALKVIEVLKARQPKRKKVPAPQQPA
jgi:hypothetical protein